MAGIFNLFGDVSELNKGSAVKSLVKSKTTLGMSNGSLKNVGQSKPKGLSMRSNSDLNVPVVPQDSAAKRQDTLKPKLTQLDNNGRPISPRKELSLKTLNESSKKVKGASPKVLFEKKTIKSPCLSDETVFKKPLLPKSYIKKSYPEPEKLAPYLDVQFEFNDVYTQTIANEFRDLLKKRQKEVVPYEDEGFESDPEPIDIKIPSIRASPISLDEEKIQFNFPEIPVISDEEDNI